MTAGLLARGSFLGRTGNSLYSGIHISSLSGNVKPWGMTPMMVAGLPLSRTSLPTMSAAPPKSRCHVPWLMITTFSAPGLLSAAVMSRPSIGLTPRMRRKCSVVYAPV